MSVPTSEPSYTKSETKKTEGTTKKESRKAQKAYRLTKEDARCKNSEKSDKRPVQPGVNGAARSETRSVLSIQALDVVSTKKAPILKTARRHVDVHLQNLQKL